MEIADEVKSAISVAVSKRRKEMEVAEEMGALTLANRYRPTYSFKH